MCACKNIISYQQDMQAICLLMCLIQISDHFEPKLSRRDISGPMWSGELLPEIAEAALKLDIVEFNRG